MTKCLLFQSYGEFTASQPWELIVTSLIGLMLTLIWIKDGSEENSMMAPSSCAAGSKEAISNLSSSDEYNGDGTQIEKVLNRC